jgi:chloride channel 3/4/5
MFEITGALTYILPIMVTLMTAKFVGDIFGGHGIAEAYIELNRYPFVDHKEEYHHNIPASKVMTEKSFLATLPSAELTMLDLGICSS